MLFYALLLICSVSTLPLQPILFADPAASEISCESEDGECCKPKCGVLVTGCNLHDEDDCPEDSNCEWICTLNQVTATPGPVRDHVDQSPSEDSTGEDNDSTDALEADILDSCGGSYLYHAQDCNATAHEASLAEKKSSGFARAGDIDWDLLRTKNSSSNSIPKDHISLLQDLDVIGPDGRWKISQWTYPYYKNVYILFDTGAGWASCSGSLISPRHVLTAGHCVSDAMGSFYLEWYCYPAYNAGLGTENGWIRHHHVWVTDRWHQGGEWGYDVAVITLDVANTGRGWFAFGFNDTVDSNTWFDVDGYPGDRVDAAGERELVAQNMQMDYSVTTDLYETETGDIVGGNSGGPGWFSTDKNDTVVNAVVSYACCGPAPYDDFNGLVRITEEKYDAICDYIESFDETKSHCTPEPEEPKGTETVTTTQSTTTTTSTSTTVSTSQKL